MIKRSVWLLGMTLCVGILFGGCGKEDSVQVPVVDKTETAEDDSSEVKIIDDNGGVVVNELLEEEDDEPISAEIVEEPEEEREPIIASEVKDGETTTKEAPVIDPVTEAEIEEGDIVADVSNLSGHQENMLILMDSLNMCMMENGSVYDAGNPEFFWKAINLTIVTYPEVPGSDSEEMVVWAEDYSSVKVHEDIVDIYADGLFASYTELPEVPAGHMVTAAEEGYYNLSVGDRGNSYGEIITWVETADGSCHVETRLASAENNETIVSYVYELVENNDENAVFAYRIKDARIKE